ncbi:PA14 domain-containing protein [Bacillus sp. N9]
MGNGSPDPSIPTDDFSAIFRKKVNVANTTYYRISGRADDGIRIYIDDEVVINQWMDGVNNFHKDILLPAGTHDIRVEYYEKNIVLQLG